VILLRKKYGTENLPYRMPLYPFPVIISVAIWLFVFYATGWFALYGSAIALAGVLVYYLKEMLIRKRLKQATGQGLAD
jgi:amino acid permease